MKNQKWSLMENGIVHTKNLKKSDAEKLLKQYQKTYPDIEFWIEPTMPNHLEGI